MKNKKKGSIMFKYLFILVLAVAIVSPVSAQEEPHNWGTQVRFGTEFLTDSPLKLRDAVRVFPGGASDTLLSDVQTRKGTDDGVFAPVFYLEDFGNGADGDSTALQMRSVVVFRWGSGSGFFSGTDSTLIQYGPWKTVWHAANKETLNQKIISPQDSTWYLPTSGWQYRIFNRGDVDGGSDSVVIHLTEFAN